MNKIKIVLGTTIIVLLIVLLISVVVPFVLGYKIAYITDAEYNFEAISAYASWAGALLPIALVFLSVYVSHQFEKEKQEISSSNLATIEYVKEMIDEMKSSTFNVNQNKYDEKNDNLKIKSKILKYINISGLARTEQIAEHFNITIDDAYDILVELLRHDKSISAGGQITKDNVNRIIWLRR